MAAPRTGPCEPWATEADLCSPCDDYDLDPDQLDVALEAASSVLFRLSGRQYPGICEATVRPCARRIADLHYRSVGGTGVLELGIPRVGCGCRRGARCGCSTLPEITLGGSPIVEVSEVRIRDRKGEALETWGPGEGRYRVDDYRRLVRLPAADGTRRGWPCCQVLDVDAGAGETFLEVDFTYGREPPPDGVRAASVLACELHLACQPEAEEKCRLPKRVREVTREGITVALLDPSDFLVDGKTGIYEVDLFLMSVNPERLQRRARVISPDVGRSVRRAGT